jgi:hypothetical protein
MSARSKIVNKLVTLIKEIDGTGTWESDLYQNVENRLRFWDEVDDYPAVFLNAGAEAREYQPGGFKWAYLSVTCRIYVEDEEPEQELSCDNPSNEMELDNGFLHVKLDLTRGGAIKYISESGKTRNIVNIHDEGRYIQQSYYAGKRVDRTGDGQNPNWSPWSWNPIQVGDSYRNRAEILECSTNENTLYTKCIPMLWDMNNKPAEATMDRWNTKKNKKL